MKRLQKRKKFFGFVRTGSAKVNKEIIPSSEANKPIFSASQLKITPPRTAEDIRRDIREGRFAEMTPDLAG